VSSPEKVVYSVTAFIPSASNTPEVATRYMEWLTEGGSNSHIGLVVAAGALDARVTRWESNNGVYVESQYIFASAQQFAQYETGPAVMLRAQGAALFGPSTGYNITFTRSTRVLVAAVDPGKTK
jgi:hypothetical protein